MIKVVANNYIKADKLDDFIALAKQLVEATKQNDSGCIQYELVHDIKDPLHLTMLEEWADQDALKQHGASAHFQEAMKQFPDFMAKPGEAHLYLTLA